MLPPVNLTYSEHRKQHPEWGGECVLPLGENICVCLSTKSDLCNITNKDFLLIDMQRVTGNTGDDRYRCRLWSVCRCVSEVVSSPAYLQPVEESLYVGDWGVWEGLLKHWQQQAIGEGEGQGDAGAWAPRPGRPGGKQQTASLKPLMQSVTICILEHNSDDTRYSLFCRMKDFGFQPLWLKL